ncbi:4-hydroxy-tetrahydrodipicolinate reductase [Halococcus saccharolyticus]|uniref:4-hydroxy-tetrahydrodipicolinate reductase n=1 Tax=Halococcus saccharolyticus DSM 5350 TaxID=1227455 RepID=M0MKJ7_9EURY|nr:4-hydroxy-tetrahydrodipicolinate reductase [Halococcus saccharolyticus]EMA44960.1 dihydrodipicolinate reductase [Halococcus saccharolyticus DSM 5350]
MTVVGVTGATGAMGRAVLETAADRDDVAVAFAVNRDPDDGEHVAGHAVHDAAALPDLLAEHQPEVVVDFTGPESTIEYAGACAEAEVGFVTGTTGLDDAERSTLREAAEAIPVLWATNFSRGVSALRSALTEAVAALPEYDIELTETHHNRKHDAPSGTATTLLDDIDAARGDDNTARNDMREDNAAAGQRTYGREGEQPRTDGEVGVHVRRAGGVRGEHEILLADNDEVLTLAHRAESREVFAAGALDAAGWLAGHEAGWYAFDDVIEGSS